MSRKKKRIILICIVICVVAAVAGYFIYKWLTREIEVSSGLEIDDNARVGIMPGVDVDQRIKELQDLLDGSMIAFSINTAPYFKSGKAYGNVLFENPGNNAKLLVAEFYLNDSSELIYKTKAIRPGSYIDKIKLDKELADGEYPVTVYIKAYDEETQEYIGQTGASITIRVGG